MWKRKINTRRNRWTVFSHLVKNACQTHFIACCDFAFTWNATKNNILLLLWQSIYSTSHKYFHHFSPLLFRCRVFRNVDGISQLTVVVRMQSFVHRATNSHRTGDGFFFYFIFFWFTRALIHRTLIRQQQSLNRCIAFSLSHQREEKNTEPNEIKRMPKAKRSSENRRKTHKSRPIQT